jgi:hypothetical protein
MFARTKCVQTLGATVQRRRATLSLVVPQTPDSLYFDLYAGILD